jgi:hypothetical protein
MPTKDDYRKVARIVKKALDVDKQAFKTYQRNDVLKELKAVAGVGAGVGAHKGEDTWNELEEAFNNEGLLVFPPFSKTEEDGYTRVFRSGSRIAAILNAIRFPGGGSDEELAVLLGRLKGGIYEQQ